MGSWWSKLWSRSKEPTAPAAPTKRSSPPAVWLEASQTPFGVPVLDLIAITGQLLSTTTQKEEAEKAMSWGTSVGDELDGAAMASRDEIACELRYPAHRVLPDGLLFVPGQMEDKWVLALRGNQLLAARSWTGAVVAIGRLERSNDEIRVAGLRHSESSGLGIFGDPVQTFDWLIRSHALGQRLPLPIDDEGARMLEAVPLTVFGPYGHRASCAARSWNPPAPSVPLRVSGRAMQAVRSGRPDTLRTVVARHEPLDVPGPVLGLTPLCVAVIRGDLAMVKTLLELGADPNLGDERRLFPLGQAIVHGHGVDLMTALLEAGARIDVVNEDGFGLLHAAAETNRAEVVAWLVGRSAALEARTGRGHTPLHIACGLGHLEALRALLAAGADIDAMSPSGNARQIAEAEGRTEAVTLLDRHRRT